MLEVIALYNGQVPEVAQLKEVIGWRCPRYLQVRIPVMIDQVIRPDSRQLYVTREWKIVGPIHLNQPKNEEAGLMDGQIDGMTQHGAPERHLSDKVTDLPNERKSPIDGNARTPEMEQPFFVKL